MIKPLTSTELNWYGKKVRLDLYDKTNYKILKPIRQVQAVSFIDPEHLVIYKSGRGNYGCPGGHPESGETWDETLHREVREEISGKVLDCGPIGYIRETNLETGEVQYLLRYWAKVELLDEPICDPCDEKRTRELVTVREAIKKLDWGDNGHILISLATKKIKW